MFTLMPVHVDRLELIPQNWGYLHVILSVVSFSSVSAEEMHVAALHIAGFKIIVVKLWAIQFCCAEV